MTLETIVYTRFENEEEEPLGSFHVVVGTPVQSNPKPLTSGQSRQRLKTLGVSTIIRYSLYPPWPFRPFS